MLARRYIQFAFLLTIILGLSVGGVRGAEILFISAMDDATLAGDEALFAFLEGLGHTVTMFDDNETEAVTEEAAAAADVVFISESVGSGEIRTEITEIETPMVITEAWGWDEMGLTLGDGGGGEVATADIEIIAPKHPLAAGFSGTVSVLTDLASERGTARFGLGQAGSEATVIARATLEDGQTYDVIFVYEKGARLALAPADGSPAFAADIRVCLGFDEQSYLVWNENAYALLEAAINYALGIGPDINLAADPSPGDGAVNVPRGVILGWTPGEAAGTHDVYFGTVLDDVNNASRADPRDVLVSQGQDANTYDPPGLLEYGQTYYWRIDEVNAVPDGTIFKGPLWSFTTEPLGHAIEGVIATTNAAAGGGGGIENTVDGSGLNDSDQHSIEPADMWLGLPSGADAIWVQYDFDRVYKLHDIWIWNYNVMFELVLGFGLKDVTVEHSVDGTDWTVLGDVEFAQAEAAEDYAHNTTLDLGGIAAKHIRLTVNSNWGGPGQYGLSEIRFLHIPTYPVDPQPASGQTDLSPDVVLGWRAGREAVSHEVYFSTDRDAVADGTALVDTVSEASYDPGTLNFGTTYHWKIVEVNEAEVIPSWEGNVWSFAIQEYAVIEDFESYDDADNRIFDTWLDGFVNGTGGTVGYFEAPFAEQTIVQAGKQSMPLAYSNADAPWYSETVREWAAPQDWAANGADTLAVHFRGNPVDFLERPDGSIVIGAAGTDIWDAADEFRFVWQRFTGDGAIVARVESLVDTDPWAKAGVMIRDTLDAASKFAAVYITPGQGCRYQARPATNLAAVSDTAVATPEQMAVTAPYWVKLERTGDQFNGFYSSDGVAWTAMSWNPQSIAMAGNIYIGLAVTSHSAGNPTIAEFSNVTMTGSVTGPWEASAVGVEQPSNDPASLYAAVEDASGNIQVVAYPDEAGVGTIAWQQWRIPFSALNGVNLSRVKVLYLGVGDRDNPAPGGSGLIYVDEIAVGHPTAP